MKIYTKTGDKGETSLVGGERVSKNSIKVESYGTIDELNSVVGMVRAIHKQHSKGGEDCLLIDEELRKIQNNLLNIGSYLATPVSKKPNNIANLKDDDITHLENLIDSMTKDLKPLSTFILPGGGMVASTIHLARTVCRRAERRIISLSEKEEIDPIVIKYVNRLSDTFFTMARWEAYNHNEPEYYWQK